MAASEGKLMLVRINRMSQVDFGLSPFARRTKRNEYTAGAQIVPFITKNVSYCALEGIQAHSATLIH